MQHEQTPAWVSVTLQLLKDGSPVLFALPRSLIAWTNEPLDPRSAAVRVADRLTFRHEVGDRSPARALGDFLRPYVPTWLSKHEQQFVVSYQLAAAIVGDSAISYARHDLSREALADGGRDAERYVSERLLHVTCDQIIERVMTGQVGR